MFERLFFFSFDMQQGHMGEGEVTTFLFNFLMFKMSHGTAKAQTASVKKIGSSCIKLVFLICMLW